MCDHTYTNVSWLAYYAFEMRCRAYGLSAEKAHYEAIEDENDFKRTWTIQTKCREAYHAMQVIAEMENG